MACGRCHDSIGWIRWIIRPRRTFSVTERRRIGRVGVESIRRVCIERAHDVSPHDRTPEPIMRDDDRVELDPAIAR